MRDWTDLRSPEDPRWADFRAEVERASRGRALETLGAKTPDGLGIQPLYLRAHRPEDAEWSATRGAGGTSRLRVLAGARDLEVANRHLLEDLERGADGALLVADVAGGWAGGCALRRRADVEKVLTGVQLPLIELAVEAGPAAWAVAEALLPRAGDAPLSLGVDPVGLRARQGALPAPRAELDAATIELVRRAPAGVRVLRVDGSPWAEAGASAELQIAAMLAAAVETWRGWAEAGLPHDAGPSRTELRVSLETDVLETVATVRALRRTFARVGAALGTDALPSVEGLPNRSALTRWDVHTNLLRLTAATAAGAMAGVNAIVAVPFDLPRAGLEPDALGRRLARNLQHILRRESHLEHVADPAGGSYYVEARTEALAEAAWARFQRFEAEGGLEAAMAEGRWQAELRDRRQARAKDVARRRASIVGVSVFPNPTEKAPPTEAASPPAEGGATVLGAALAERIERDAPWAVEAPAQHEPAEAVPFVRWSAPFEALRDRSARGRAPRAFLVNVGRRADFSARSTWIFNLLTAGGIAVVDSDGFEDASVAAAAFAAEGADLAVLCGSDDGYRAHGAAFAAALSERGAVYLAGALLPELEGAAFAGAVTAKDDALAFLEGLWAQHGDDR